MLAQTFQNHSQAPVLSWPVRSFREDECRARPPSPGSPSLAGIVLDINAPDLRMHIDNVITQLARIAGKRWQRSEIAPTSSSPW